MKNLIFTLFVLAFVLLVTTAGFKLGTIAYSTANVYSAQMQELDK